MFRRKIVLVDDHRILLDAVAMLIEKEFDVIAKFDDGRMLLEQVEVLKPDVVLLDVEMPKMNGFLVGLKLKEILPKLKLIYLTMHESLETASQAFQLGASGYILKSSPGEELLVALREVVRGGYYASPELRDGMNGSFVNVFRGMARRHTLTVRQMEVLQMIAKGMSMKEVARQLKISASTVAFHKYTMMQLLDLRNTAELLNYAYSNRPS